MGKKIPRIIMWEENGEARQGTKLLQGDTIRLQKVPRTISYFRPSTNNRLFIGEDDKRTIDTVGSFWEIVLHLSAAIGLGYVIRENTEQEMKVQFVDPFAAVVR